MADSCGKKRVIFLIYSLCGNGAQRVLIDTANMLSEDEKLDITVRALFHDADGALRLSAAVHYRAAFRFKRAAAHKLASGFVQYVLPPRVVYRWLCCGGYDIEVAFMEAFPTKILAYSSNTRAKKYAWVHIDMAEYTQQDRLYRSLEHQRWCYARFDKICCVSVDVQKAFVQRFGLGERTCVVYNQLCCANIRAQSRQACPGLPAQRPLVVSIGSLVERKRFDMLIRACALLRREGVVFRLLILGEGPEKVRLERLIKEHGLTAQVSLLGYCSNPYPYLAAADLYVCASRAEGYSTAVSEALILGVPVVTTACAGMQELLAGSGSGLITAGNESALCEGMRRLLLDDALRAHCRANAARRGELLAARAGGSALRKLFE